MGPQKKLHNIADFWFSTSVHLLHPELFQAKMCPVHIVTHGSYTRGMSVVNEQETDPDKCNTLVLMHGDRDKFIEYFLEDIKYLDKNY